MQNEELPIDIVPFVVEAIHSIEAKKALRIVYHGEERLVEVHAIGLSTKGNPCVRVYQVVGGSVFSDTSGWKMLKISDIEQFEETNDEALTPRPGFNPGDRGMRTIISEVSQHEPSNNTEERSKLLRSEGSP